MQRRIEARAAKKRLKRGFDTIDPRSESVANISSPSDRDLDDPEAATDVQQTEHPTMGALAAEAEQDTAKPPTHSSLSRRLALSIQKVSVDIRLSEPKRYAYEEWVEFTRLIRLTTPERLNDELGTVATENEDEEGLVNWDWIGNDSPMMSTMSESEWLLERLCESLVRLEKRKEIAYDQKNLGGMMRDSIEAKEESDASGPQMGAKAHT